MEQYIEIAVGSPRNRNIIIKKSHLPYKIAKCRRDDEELYQSYYTYDENILDHFKIRKTVKNYRSNFYLDQLIFDIDKGTKTDSITLQAARDFFTTLTDEWDIDENAIKIWYSGRGYHLTIPNFFKFEPGNFLPTEVKNTVEKYFPQVDLAPLCPTGLIRVGYTLNNKVQRYKIPLKIDEFFKRTSEQILVMAENKNFRKLVFGDADLTTDLSAFTVKAKEEREAERLKREPTRVATCIQKIYNRGPIEGERHNDILIMASSFYRQGLPPDAIHTLMKDWAIGMEPVEVSRHVEDTIKRGYVYGCSNTTMAKYCDPKCIFYAHKNFLLEADSSKDTEKKYVNYIRTIEANSINIKDIYEFNRDITLVPSDYVLFIGGSGLNKTTFAQILAVKSRPKNVMYLNLEFAAELLFRRNVQIATGMTKEQVEEYYKKSTNGLSQEIDHIRTLDNAPTFADIKKLITIHNPQLLIIDTITDINLTEDDKKGFSYSDDKGKIISVLTKRLAREMKLIIIGVHHISKSAAFDDKGKPKKLTLQSGLGSGSLHQKADWVWGIEGMQSSTLRKFLSLKARDSENFEYDYELNPETFGITKISN